MCFLPRTCVHFRQTTQQLRDMRKVRQVMQLSNTEGLLLVCISSLLVLPVIVVIEFASVCFTENGVLQLPHDEHGGVSRSALFLQFFRQRSRPTISLSLKECIQDCSDSIHHLCSNVATLNNVVSFLILVVGHVRQYLAIEPDRKVC